jgi:tetratricopeptide (TPR) repeat protein
MARFAALIIACMSLGESAAQTWIERGKEAYGHLQLAEAAQDFEKAVSADPQSLEARLCFGVASLFLYQNGLGDAQAKFFDPDSRRPLSRAEVAAELNRTRVLIAEQNSTNGKRAEENLLQALQLDPQNKLAMEYLAALCHAWLDPISDSLGNNRYSRLTDALHWYKRIIEIDPGHSFANYVCGVIDWESAFEIMRASGSYPRPLPSEEARRSLHSQIAPLLDDGARNLARSLEIDPNNWNAMSYLSAVKRAQAYVAGTNSEYLLARSEADDLNRKVNEILEAQAKAAGQPWPPGPIATLTFDPVPQESQGNGKTALPAFPPDPKQTIPPGIPPPPPAVRN